FFAEPPAGFAEHPLLSPRPSLFIGREDQLASLDAAWTTARARVGGIVRQDVAQTRAMAPMLREGYAAGSVCETQAADIDVHELHHGFLRGATRRGARIVCDAPVHAIARESGLWRVATRSG